MSSRADTNSTEWAVIDSNGNVVMTKETKRDAEDAALWLSQTWGGERLRVAAVVEE
jgi:hypothetical protein